MRFFRGTKVVLPVLAAALTISACSSGSDDNSADAAQVPQSTTGSTASTSTVAYEPEASASAKLPKLRPSPAKAKHDKGRMFDRGCMSNGKDTAVKPCFFGKRNGDVTVALFGDSHALQYGPPLIKLANQRGWNLIALARGRCTMADVKYERGCDSWRKRAIKRIGKAKPDLVVVSTSTGTRFKVKKNGKTLSRGKSEVPLRAGMARTMRKLGNFGNGKGGKSKVTLIRDQALAPFRPPDCLKVKKNRRKPSRCGFKAKRPKTSSYDYFGSIRVKKVNVIDPMPLLCPKGWCRSVENGMIIYRDKYHYTATWAETITPWLGKRIGGLR